MGEPKYHRLALAQLSFNPAYMDVSGVSYLHEPVFPGDEANGLHKLGGLSEVHELRSRIATTLIDHMSHKIKAVVEFAARQEVELLVLPEYSVTHELLEECKDLSRQFDIVIVAGSHILSKLALEEHVRLKIAKGSGDADPGRAVCPVFLPTGECHLFEKTHRSKWESSVIPGQASGPFSVVLNGEAVQLEVLICIDAVTEGGPQKPRRGRAGATLTVIPSLTPSTKLFYNRAELLLASGKVTLFANIAEFGGSRLYSRRGDEIGAESYFKSAIDADTNNAFAYFEYARFLKHLERYPEGLEMAMAALETNPRDYRHRQLVDDLRARLQSASSEGVSIP